MWKLETWEEYNKTRFNVKLTFSGKYYSGEPHSVGQKNVRNNKPKKNYLNNKH